jgi:hypothetical protein
LPSTDESCLRAIIRWGLRRADHIAPLDRFEDLLRTGNPLAIIPVDRNKVGALADTTRVPLGFHFWNAGANQAADVAPAAPAPASAATIGPAATSGPMPGIARAPMPTSHPRTPPTAAPAPAPVTAPSGAFELISWARSLVVRSRSGRIAGDVAVSEPGGAQRIECGFKLDSVGEDSVCHEVGTHNSLLLRLISSLDG